MPIELDDVVAAADRLDGVANRTPVLTSRMLNGMTDASGVFLKAEMFQRGGAFKFRGAYNRIARVSTRELERGVATYSSGNHAQAVALASGLLGTRAVIVMPEDAPPEKIAATQGYGAEIVLYDRYREDREALGRRIAEERGLTLVPPYEDPLVMAGQGTAALELLQAVGTLDVLVAPVGGGSQDPPRPRRVSYSASMSSASSLSPATIPVDRWRPVSAFASPSRERLPTASWRTSRGS
jgi:threonine dehydratase